MYLKVCRLIPNSILLFIFNVYICIHPFHLINLSYSSSCTAILNIGTKGNLSLSLPVFGLADVCLCVLPFICHEGGRGQ